MKKIVYFVFALILIQATYILSRKPKEPGTPNIIKDPTIKTTFVEVKH